ncbi:glutathione synthase [Flavobacteriaceae bacterium UJ101]|nr:glutathione synthase [Flavobacteriaceae bacterium UJ101]
MKIVFLLYPWETINPKKDTSIILIHEALKRNHDVYITLPEDIMMSKGKAMALAHKLSNFTISKASNDSDYQEFYQNLMLTSETIILKEIDTIFIRSNPPINPYTMDILETVQDDVFICNSIRGLRKGKTKIYTALNDDGLGTVTPITHITRNIDQIVDIVKNSKEEGMILKPLDGMGGKGVLKLNKTMTSNLRVILDYYLVDGNYIILQDFIKGAEKGDTRVLVLNGEPIGAIQRIPAQGEHRSNLSAGGKMEIAEITPEIEKICNFIAPKLREDGLFFCGLDIISNQLVEINVTSPGGIREVNQTNQNIRIQEKVIDFIEQKIKE